MIFLCELSTSSTDLIARDKVKSIICSYVKLAVDYKKRIEGISLSDKFW